jgi:hypothetical protein
MPVKNAEALRDLIVSSIDATLEAPWIVRRWLSADAQRVLRATRRYWLADDGTQLAKLLALVESEPVTLFEEEPSMSYYPYPTDLPTSEIRDLVNYLRGAEPPSVNHGVHCAWVVAGFGASQVLPCDEAHVRSAAGESPQAATTPAPKAKGQPATLSRTEAADKLEQLVGTVDRGPGFAAPTIPWQILLPIILDWAAELVKQWLQS